MTENFKDNFLIEKLFMIVFGAITPHPPVIIPGIGDKESLKMVRETIKAMEKLRQNLEEADPETLILISPHAEMEMSRFVINSDVTLRGSFANFGLDEIFDFKNDIEAIERITYFNNISGIPTHLHESFLDHGALVPLFYLTKNIKPKIIHLAFSMLDNKTHFQYGHNLSQMCCEKGKRIGIISSGDLSHRTTLDAPAGYSPEGKKFDEKLISLLSKGDVDGILKIDKELIEEAGECGLRSIIILLGALNGKYKFKLLNYEAPFGVGYLAAQLIAQ